MRSKLLLFLFTCFLLTLFSYITVHFSMFFYVSNLIQAFQNDSVEPSNKPSLVIQNSCFCILYYILSHIINVSYFNGNLFSKTFSKATAYVQDVSSTSTSIIQREAVHASATMKYTDSDINWRGQRIIYMLFNFWVCRYWYL